MEKRQVNVSEQINKSKLNKWHIIIFLIGLLIIILNGYNQSIYGIALPYLMEDTGIDTAVFGLIGTYCLIGMFKRPSGQASQVELFELSVHTLVPIF